MKGGDFPLEDKLVDNGGDHSAERAEDCPDGRGHQNQASYRKIKKIMIKN